MYCTVLPYIWLHVMHSKEQFTIKPKTDKLKDEFCGHIVYK